MKRERYQTIFGILFVAILTFFMFVSSSNSQVFDDQWGGYGGGDGQFDKPIGIAIDYLGNVFVTDTGNSRVQKLDLRGNYITSWGAYGTGNGQFQFPTGICIDSTNSVYVVDAGNMRVQKLDNKEHS